MTSKLCAAAVALMLIIACELCKAEETIGIEPPNKECGPISAYAMLRLLGDDQLCLDDVRKLLPIHGDGVSMLAIADVIRKRGRFAYPMRLSPADWTSVRDPVIAFIRRSERNPYPHFFILIPVGDGKLQMVDPPYAPAILGVDRLASMKDAWEGDVLICRRTPSLQWTLARSLPWILSSLVAVCGVLVVCLLRLKSRRPRGRVTYLAMVCLSSLPAAVAVARYIKANDLRQDVVADRAEIAVDQTKLDFGLHAEIGCYDQSVLIRNVGKVDVRVTKAIASCSCVTGTLPTQIISPGESARVVIQLRLDEEKKYHQNFALFINDRFEPSAFVDVTGELKLKK